MPVADRHSPICVRNEEVGVVKYRDGGVVADVDGENSVARLV